MVVAVSDEDTVLAVEVLPGHASDAPRVERMLEATVAAVGPVDEIVADKAFDGDAQRAACLERGVMAVIPNRRDRVDPWPFDPVPYRRRNHVERLSCKAKRFRAMATQHDKLKVTCNAVLCLVFGFLRLRRFVGGVNTT